MPFAWLLSTRSGTIDKTVDPAQRAEVKAKLANFVRAPWMQPPFGGAQLTDLLLDAFEAMAKGPKGAPLLPDYQPLDLFVTVTDFHGYPELLRLNSPPEVIETEHRLTISFQDPGGERTPPRRSGRAGLCRPRDRELSRRLPAFQGERARRTVSRKAKQGWPGRDAFLARAMPRRHALGEAEQAILIDGSVLAQPARSAPPPPRWRSGRPGARWTAASSISTPSPV